MRTISQRVQKRGPFAAFAPRKVYTLPVADLHPLIRIAHEQPHPPVVAERIILDHEFVLLRRGEGAIRIEGAEYSLGPHALVLIPPFVPHVMTAPRGGLGAHLAVHFDLAPSFPPLARHLERRPPYEVRLSHGLALPRVVQLHSGHPVEQSLVDLVRVRDAGGPLAELEACVLLLRALLVLLGGARKAAGAAGASAPAERNTARLKRSLTLIHEHYARDLGAEELAEAAGLSVSHFNRLFAQWTGHSPAQYLRQVRVEAARGLLADVDLSIKQIAGQTGFKSPYHFSKVFRQIDGLSPTQYREALLAGALAQADDRK